MSDLMFQPTVPTGCVIAAHLGADGTAPNRFTDKEIGKAVKLAGLDNYVLCADGDELEGVVLAIEPGTIDNGFSYGSVQKDGRVIAINTGSGALTVGTYVVASAQAALGTANATGGNNFDPCPQVEAGSAGVPGTSFAVPATYKWRVISLLGGNGAVNSAVLIEKQ